MRTTYNRRNRGKEDEDYKATWSFRLLSIFWWFHSYKHIRKVRVKYPSPLLAPWYRHLWSYSDFIFLKKITIYYKTYFLSHFTPTHLLIPIIMFFCLYRTLYLILKNMIKPTHLPFNAQSSHLTTNHPLVMATSQVCSLYTSLPTVIPLLLQKQAGRALLS